MPRNGDGLFQHGANWHFRYLDSQGKLRERSTGKDKLRDAKGVRDEFLEQLRKGQLPTDLAKWPLERALAEFLENRRHVVSPTTLPPERTAVRHLCELIGGAKRLEQITPLDLARYQATRRRSVGPKTVNNELLVLIAVLKQAKLWHSLEEAYRPAARTQEWAWRGSHRCGRRALDAISSTRSSWTVALCASLLAQQAGCRAGEIKKLRIGDIHIDGDRPFLRIRRETTKSDAGAREAALNEVAIWAVRRLLARARLLGATSPRALPAPRQPLQAHQGHRIRCTIAAALIRPVTRRPGPALGKPCAPRPVCPKLRFHDLRHTHITWAIQAGVPIEVVMAQVGHISPGDDPLLHALGLWSEARSGCKGATQTVPGVLTALTAVSISEQR